MKTNSLLYYLAVCFAFLSCNKNDNYVYPSVITELVTIETDDEGRAVRVITDKQQLFEIVNRDQISTFAPDTFYRVACIFEIEQERSAYIYSLQFIYSEEPFKIGEFSGEIKSDPIDIESIWLTESYINFAALVKVHSMAHSYKFIEVDKRIDENKNQQSIRLHFYHDRQGDVEGYTQRTYFSIPLSSYKNILHKGDSIFFSINTYKEGLKTYRFAYQ